MLRSLILKKLDREEKFLGESIERARHMLRRSFGAFLRFGMFMPMARYRKKLPVVPHAVAGIVASRHADCGTCVQIGERGLIEMSMAIAAAQVFPLVKRGMGYATSCARVQVKV